jgi:O-antigen/teichoic acid export membrane protein
MSRTRRFLGGIGFGYASQALTTLVGLWLTPFLLYRIGQHDYGLWLVGTQMMFYLALLDLGVVALLPRETAFATGRANNIEETPDLPVLVGDTARIVLWQMPFVALAAIIAWFAMPVDWEGLRHPIALVLVAFVLTFPLRVFSGVLQGLQDLAFLGRIGIIAYLTSTSITVALVFAGLGLYALAIGWITMQIIVAGAGWYRLRAHFPFVLPVKLPNSVWATTRSRLNQGLWVSAGQVAQVLLNGTDILIIGKIFGPAAAVPYACTGKLINVLANQPQLLMQSAVPALSQMRVGESRERLTQVSVALGQAMLLISGGVVCVALTVNQPFVGRWVGADQYGGFSLTLLLLLTMILRHWNSTLIYTLFCFGYERRLAITALFDGLVTIGAMTIFLHLYGILGAPLGTITGVCIVSLPANLRTLARESEVSVRVLIRPLWPWFIRFSALATAAAVVARIWSPSALWLIGLTAIVAALVYALVMLPIALGSALGIYVRPRLSPLGARMMRALRLRATV